MMSQHLLHARHATLLEPAVCPLANGNRHTYTHTRAYTVTHTLSNDSANSHDRKTRTQTIKSLFVPAWGG